MTELLNFVIEHGYLVVFVWIALDQAGLPLPAVPLLLIAGVLIGMGEMSLGPLIAVVILATVPIDYFWYWLGRLRGARVLHLLCILSLEPDYCVRNTENIFRRLGPVSLIIGKFVPGLQTLAPPMSGMTGVSVTLFLLLDTIGTILWAGLVIALGYYFHNEIEYLVTQLAEAGLITGSALIGIALGYLAWKLFHRQKFVRSLRMRRIEPNELYERIQKGEDVHILDLRHDYDVKALPHLLPNALRVPMEAIERHKHRIPKDSDIILCCN
jgi:membrane protein DedA with SNARE-associated domain